MDPKMFWEIFIHILTIGIAIVVATIRIGKMLQDEMSAHGDKMLKAVGEVEARMVASIDAIWKSQDKQDVKISEVEKGHYRLEGRLQGIGIRMAERPSGDERDP